MTDIQRKFETESFTVVNKNPIMLCDQIIDQIKEIQHYMIGTAVEVATLDPIGVALEPLIYSS